MSAPVAGDSDLHYLGIAPVRKHPATGRHEIRREEIRFAPEFGYDPSLSTDPAARVGGHAADQHFAGESGCSCARGVDPRETTMHPMHAQQAFGAGVNSGQDGQGLSYYPADEGWLDRWMWETEELTADVAELTNTDGDFYDDVTEPDNAFTLIAGGPADGGEMNYPIAPNQAEFGRRRLPAGMQRGAMRQQMAQRGMHQQPQAQTSSQKWQKTAIVAAAAPAAAGAYAAIVRVQFDFVAQDAVTDGTTTTIGATITSIIFGDYTVFNVQVGIPVAVMVGASFLRGIVKGAKLKGGLDIQVNGAVTGAGNVRVTFVGLKPQTGAC